MLHSQQCKDGRVLRVPVIELNIMLAMPRLPETVVKINLAGVASQDSDRLHHLNGSAAT